MHDRRPSLIETPRTMFGIRLRPGYLFIGVILAEVILISAQVQTSTGSKLLNAAAFGLVSEIQLGASRVFTTLRGGWDGYFWLRGTYQENQRLKQQVSDLELLLQQQQALARRGAELEQLLDLRESTSLRTMAANVIAADTTGGFQFVTIDRGSHDGLHQNMAIISSRGVVGRIVDQPPSMYAAKVQLLIDRSAGAGAIVERSNAGGVVVGQEGDPPLRMDFVSNLADVKVGDRVVSSGLDGIYPRGFAIGVVERVSNGAKLYKDIAIRPVVDFSALQTVLVVLDPPPRPASPRSGS
jgi:rod shape-determining protein MreC